METERVGSARFNGVCFVYKRYFRIIYSARTRREVRCPGRPDVRAAVNLHVVHNSAAVAAAGLRTRR